MSVLRYLTDDIIIIEGDSLDVLSKLSKQSFQLVVTSPPYNIGKEYDKKLSLDNYIDWCETWMNDIYTLVNPSGSFWLNLGYVSVEGKGKAVPIPYLLWNRSDFFMIQEVVWNYGAGVSSSRSFSPRNEKFIWFVKDSENYYFDLDSVRDPNVKYPNQKKNGKVKVNPLGKNPTDVWAIPKVTSGKNRSSKERTDHPAQFPTAVVERIIKSCSRPGDWILDPFLGSGTVTEVALRLGRRAVGIDINSKYLDTAIERVNIVYESGDEKEYLEWIDKIEGVLQSNYGVVIADLGREFPLHEWFRQNKSVEDTVNAITKSVELV